MVAQQVTYLRVFVCRISVILCVIVETMVMAFHCYSNMFPSPRKIETKTLTGNMNLRSENEKELEEKFLR